MKVNSNRDITFKSIYTNKALKKGLEFAADNGALFKATAAVGFSVLRPLAIMCTPNTDKENREIASAKSITSSLIGFFLMLGISTPLAKSLKKIDENPKKYLNPQTTEFFKKNSDKITNSKAYILSTQIFKLGIDGIVSIPKAILVTLGMPYIIDLFHKNDNKNSFSQTELTPKKNANNNISFYAKPTEKLAARIGNTINNKKFQAFADKYKDSNFPMHIMAITDICATSAFIQSTKINSKIKDERKKTLIYNSTISTLLSITCGYLIDKLLDKPTEKLINNFRKYNTGKANLEKQIQGIRITKPIIILGTIYYLIIPFISTFLAEKAGEKKTK